MRSLVGSILYLSIYFAVGTHAYAASFTPIGFLASEAPYSGASAVSADGRTVVGVSRGDEEFYAYIWTR